MTTSLGDKIRAVAEFNDRPMVALAREADAQDDLIYSLRLQLDMERERARQDSQYLIDQVAHWKTRAENGGVE